MPPVTYWQQTAIAWDLAMLTATISVPSRARPGDTLVAILATSTLIGQTTPAGWQVFGQLIDSVSGTGVNFLVLFRVVEEDEPATAAIVYAGAPAVPPLGACLLYRGLDAEQTVPVGAGFSKFSVATTHLVAPSAALAAYSDVYIGMFWSAAVGATYTPINSLVERVDVATGGGTAGSFAIADVLPGVAGASGGREATCSAAATGAAACVVLAARGLPSAVDVAALTPTIGAPGTIGLPLEGV